MKKPIPRKLSVSHTETITPNMQRVRLHGDELAAFPADCESGYIKLLFNAQGGTDLSELADDQRPIMRTYTIRRFYKDRNEIDIDMVLHETEGEGGFAAQFAASAQIGDEISIAGPGSLPALKRDASWYFFVADMTAMPALAAKIRELPFDAKGYAVIQVTSLADKQVFKVPENIEVVWVEAELEQQVKSLQWLDDEPFVWCACEFEQMKQLREYFRNEKAVSNEMIYISSYWKKGVTEEGHKALKQQENNEG